MTFKPRYMKYECEFCGIKSYGRWLDPNGKIVVIDPYVSCQSCENEMNERRLKQYKAHTSKDSAIMKRESNGY